MDRRGRAGVHTGTIPGLASGAPARHPRIAIATLLRRVPSHRLRVRCARPGRARRARGSLAPGATRAPVVIIGILHERRASSAVQTSSTSTAAQACLDACPTFQRIVVVDGGTQRARCGGAPRSDASILARLRLIREWDSESLTTHCICCIIRPVILPTPRSAQHDQPGHGGLRETSPQRITMVPVNEPAAPGPEER